MDEEAANAAVSTLPAAKRTSWRYFLIRDGLTIVSLTLVALLLGAVTTFLFRSFQTHRQSLSRQWARQGRDALQHGQARQAVAALRTSLTYDPDDHDTQLALAEALAASGHFNEAENYFLTLWDEQPGDGPINLQLARLERLRGNAPTAINYYRAAVFGTWEGDAPVRRRDTRLELAKYLTERGEVQAARSELLIAAGNNPDPATQLTIAEALQQANDPADAMTAYRNALQGGTDREVAEAKAGELCYRMGNYACAGEFLQMALRAKRWTPEQITRMAALQTNAERLQQLSFGSEVSQPTRAARLLADARLAQNGLKLCVEQHTAPDTIPLQQVQSRWKDLDTARSRSALRHDDGLQQRYAALIHDTEKAMQNICGAPAGDNALLLYLHDHPVTTFGATKG